MARIAKWRVSEFKVQELANTAWAFGTAGQSDEMLCWASARSAEWQVSEFKPQELANTTWAFAIAGQSDEKAPWHSRVPWRTKLIIRSC